jgi:hypothetical protein
LEEDLSRRRGGAEDTKKKGEEINILYLEIKNIYGV